MYVFENHALPRSELPGNQYTTLGAVGNGAQHLSIWRQTIDPGQSTQPHRHDCEEMVMVSVGHGWVIVGNESFDFGPDSTLVLPAVIEHQIINSGNELMDIIGVFPTTPVVTWSFDDNAMDLPWPS